MSNERDNEEARVSEKLGQLFPPRPDTMPEAAALLESAEAEREYAAILESQCGATDDSQPVEQYDGSLGVTTAFVDANQPMVGQLQWNSDLGDIYDNAGNVSGVRWATGTLISNDLFLTAGHNFDQTGGGWTRPRDNATGSTIPPTEIATNMHVNFDFQVDPSGNPRPEQEFPVLELVEYRMGGLDFAIVRLGGNPGATFGSAQISTTDATTGAVACIIGHPAGVPKRVEAGPVTDLHGDQIGYNDIDTLGGNSGSAILLGSNGRIVGVHTNGGCTVSDPNSDTSHNHGVRITSILAQSPTLQSLTGPTIGPKLKAVDDGITLKFIDDGGTLKFFDDGGNITLKFLDDGGTLKFLDDVKLPSLDKQLGDRKLPGSDVSQPFQPGPVGRRQAAGGRRPFVLSTPHHSTAWSRQLGGEAAGASAERELAARYEQAITQLGQLIQQGSEELAQLQQTYQQAVAEYQELVSGGNR